MAGKFHKALLYQPGLWRRHFPDWKFVKTFYRHFTRQIDTRLADALQALPEFARVEQGHLKFLAVRNLLRGKGQQLPPSLPLRNLVAQASRVPSSEHEAYFREQLAGVDAPTAPFGILDVQIKSS